MVDTYLDVNDFKKYLNITTLDATTVPTEAQVISYINMAEGDFENDIGVFKNLDQTKIVKGIAIGLYVPDLPISTISTISLSNGDLITPIFTLIPSTDWTISDNAAGRVLLRNPFINREYEVNYTSGYTYLDMPEKIKYITFLYTMNYLIDTYVFDTQGGSESKSEIIDVGAYKEITKNTAVNGKGALLSLIDHQKSLFKGKLKTRVGYM